MNRIFLYPDTLFPFFIFPEVRKVTILSDSTAKNVSGIDGCVAQAFHGDTIAKLTNRIENKQTCFLMIM